jgi:hypothetical protein
MDGGKWRGEAWPAPDTRARRRLPRVDELRASEHGYDREQVRDAFDAFYRHIAQLDSTLRALEAVEVFRDQAGELRKELRALKAAGWTQQPWPSYGRERVSSGIPEALPRFAIEAAFLIVVAVVVAVAGFDRLSIVLVMALAWAIVGVVEWAASRERFARTRVPAPARTAVEPAAPAPLHIVPADAAPAESWEAPVAPPLDEVQEPEPEEERTVIRAEVDGDPPDAERPPEFEAEASVAEVAEEPEPAPALELEPVELEAHEPEPVAELETEPVAAEAVQDLEAEAPEPEPEAEPVFDAAPVSGHWSWAADATVERARERALTEHPPQPRRRFWQRRRRDSDGMQLDPLQPRHVRVLPPEPSFDEQFPVDPAGTDPWEQDLDLSIEEPEGSLNGEPEPAREAALDHGERP